MSERVYRDLSKRERFALMAESLKPSERAAVMARVEKHFRGRKLSDDPNELMNVVLREAWRNKHGEVESWDRAARASGVVVR